jgi:3'-phosphoadenosine 5'-phosphosulfate sulfotransferase (PAPS reductase)/FAD synthetase
VEAGRGSVGTSNMIHVVSISGGKDSTALWLWALRSNLDPLIPIFCDTKWEATQTYQYLDLLETRLGPLRRLVSEGFEERTLRNKTFPSRVRKWCSPELKVAMCAEELNRIRAATGDEVEVLVGFRREESPSREAALVREYMPEYDCEVYRPILDWTLDDVIQEHHRAGIPLNPLYIAGAERVGCWPCIHARKSEIRLIAEIDPERIERVAAIEREIGQTMFAVEESRKGKSKDDPRRVIPLSIHETVAWSRTKRGGLELADTAPITGCARWGSCEAPIRTP